MAAQLKEVSLRVAGVEVDPLYVIATVVRCSRAYGDRVWNDFRYWSRGIPWKVADRVVSYPSGLDVAYLGGAPVAMQHVLPETRLERRDRLEPNPVGTLVSSEWFLDRECISMWQAPYEIRINGEVVPRNMDDWRPIAEVSGKADQRRMRIAIANRTGHMMGELFGPKGASAVIEDLWPICVEYVNKKSARGDGWIVYVGTMSDKVTIILGDRIGGYYQPIEKERVRLLKLVRPYSGASEPLPADDLLKQAIQYVETHWVHSWIDEIAVNAVHEAFGS